MNYYIATKGLPEQDILQRIANGWAVIAGVQIAGPAIATPGMDPNLIGTRRVDVWFLPEPMMPQGLVIATLVAAARNGMDVVTLNELALRFFGQTLGALEAMMVKGAGNQPVEALEEASCDD